MRRTVQLYTCPEQMEAAHAAAKAEVTPTTREPLTWRVNRVELGGVWLVRIQESSPRVRYVELDPARTFFSFPTSPSSRITVAGALTPVGGIVRHGAGQTFYERTHGPTKWAILSMQTSEIAEVGNITAGFDITASSNLDRITPPPEAMDRLRRLHAAIGEPDENAPFSSHQEVERACRQSLIEAMAMCVAGARSETETWAQGSHQLVMRRFRRLLDEYPTRALYVPEVCAAIRVPERTLRLCFQEHLGMSPKHYLTLRRLHLARRALLTASEGLTVTEVATQFGFWHFGRFARNYYLVHGERPSETLARR